jgi:hypothetical protein
MQSQIATDFQLGDVIGVQINKQHIIVANDIGFVEVIVNLGDA